MTKPVACRFCRCSFGDGGFIRESGAGRVFLRLQTRSFHRLIAVGRGAPCCRRAGPTHHPRGDARCCPKSTTQGMPPIAAQHPPPKACVAAQHPPPKARRPSPPSTRRPRHAARRRPAPTARGAPPIAAQHPPPEVRRPSPPSTHGLPARAAAAEAPAIHSRPRRCRHCLARHPSPPHGVGPNHCLDWGRTIASAGCNARHATAANQRQPAFAHPSPPLLRIGPWRPPVAQPSSPGGRRRPPCPSALVATARIGPVAAAGNEQGSPRQYAEKQQVTEG